MKFHGTTLLSVRHRGKVAMGADGQVTLGPSVMKHGARKVRRLYKDSVLAGFAGSAADGFALFTRFEARLEEFVVRVPAVAERQGEVDLGPISTGVWEIPSSMVAWAMWAFR